MESEASASSVPIAARVSEELNLELLAFARERRLMRAIITYTHEGKRKKTSYIPNRSEAARVALEEFFAGRKGK